jgi:biotin operon repressor
VRVREKILSLLRSSDGLNGVELSRKLGVTRQAVNPHLQRLIRDGVAWMEGRTRGAFYHAGRPTSKSAPARFTRRVRLSGLEEDQIFQDAAIALNLEQRLSREAYDIVHYAFTEMLNNAIDHSRSTYAQVVMTVDSYTCAFRLRDMGVGVFHSIAAKFKLKDESQAVAELLKGKTTTMRSKHTGEGIFFTSRACDHFALRSHRTELIIDNERPDVGVGRSRPLKGTEVRLDIRRNTRRHLRTVFADYAPEEFDFQFNRTRVLVRLFRDVYVSRSEAKRLLTGLDRFREVILDFQGVRSLGQAFADEIFRIFRAAHPDIAIRVENLDPVIQPILRHVLDNSNVDNLTIS